MARDETVKVEGLKEFRKALKDVTGDNAKELTKALKEAGRILPPKIRPGMGSVSARVGNPTASGTKGKVPVRHQAAAAAEFSKKGAYGRTMTARYGPPPRYGYKAVKESSGEIEDELLEGLEDIITIHGWAKE